MQDTPINKIITDTRALNALKKQGYETYSDIRELTREELYNIPAMGAVSAERALMDIEEFRNSLYKELMEKVKDAADKFGVERVLELIESLEKEEGKHEE